MCSPIRRRRRGGGAGDAGEARGWSRSRGVLFRMSGGSQEARDADALGGTCVLTEALDGPGSIFGTEMVYLPNV